MKAFKDWWRKRGDHIWKLQVSMQKPYGMTKEEIAEMSWKAALEWARREFYTTPKNYNEIINKELNGSD